METKDVYSELNAIRSLMERSAKFISLSGLSGILAGIYALAGCWLAYRLVYLEGQGLRIRDYYILDTGIWQQLVLIALGVLVLSLGTGILLSVRKARRKQENCWNEGSKRLLTSMAIPLSAGGLFILIMLFRGDYQVIAPSCLLFYGLSLIAGSQYTFSDVKWLGIFEILLGLLAALMPGYGLIFWACGFGVLHILYGIIMHFKYDR